MHGKPINHLAAFTLIELLVVISIVGILAAVTFGFMATARQDGNEASGKASINSFKTQAELIRSNTKSFLSVCTDPGTATILRAIAEKSLDADKLMTATLTTASSATEAVCHSTRFSWAISVPMAGNRYFCSDSSGISGFRVTTLVANATVCPAS